MPFTTAQASNCLRCHRRHLARSTLALFSPETSGHCVGTSVLKSQPFSRSRHDCVPAVHVCLLFVILLFACCFWLSSSLPAVGCALLVVNVSACPFAFSDKLIESCLLHATMHGGRLPSCASLVKLFCCQPLLEVRGCESPCANHWYKTCSGAHRAFCEEQRAVTVAPLNVAFVSWRLECQCDQLGP